MIIAYWTSRDAITHAVLVFKSYTLIHTQTVYSLHKKNNFSQKTLDQTIYEKKMGTCTD